MQSNTARTLLTRPTLDPVTLRALHRLYRSTGNVVPETEHEPRQGRVRIVGEARAFMHAMEIVHQQHIAGLKLEANPVFLAFRNLLYRVQGSTILSGHFLTGRLVGQLHQAQVNPAQKVITLGIKYRSTRQSLTGHIPLLAHIHGQAPVQGIQMLRAFLHHHVVYGVHAHQ